jgi:hypothetical protein
MVLIYNIVPRVPGVHNYRIFLHVYVFLNFKRNEIQSSIIFFDTVWYGSDTRVVVVYTCTPLNTVLYLAQKMEL